MKIEYYKVNNYSDMYGDGDIKFLSKKDAINHALNLKSLKYDYITTISEIQRKNYSKNKYALSIGDWKKSVVDNEKDCFVLFEAPIISTKILEEVILEFKKEGEPYIPGNVKIKELEKCELHYRKRNWSGNLYIPECAFYFEKNLPEYKESKTFIVDVKYHISKHTDEYIDSDNNE
jgi:hypothetical protein